MEKYSGLKVVKTSQGKKVYEIEPTIIKDFSLQDNSFLINVGELQSNGVEYECADVAYASTFDESVIKKIITPDFQEKIDGFIEKSNAIYSNYSFLEKGKLTLPRLKDVCKALEKDQFLSKEIGCCWMEELLLVIKRLFEFAETITVENADLEYKIILSMAI